MVMWTPWQVWTEGEASGSSEDECLCRSAAGRGRKVSCEEEDYFEGEVCRVDEEKTPGVGLGPGFRGCDDELRL